MLALLTVIVGPNAKAKGRRIDLERISRLLAELVRQRINAQYDEARPCDERGVVVRLFMGPECPVHLFNAGDVSLSLELDESDLAGRNQEEIQDFTETLAEVIKTDGPFMRADKTMPVVHCHVRCGQTIGRVVMF